MSQQQSDSGCFVHLLPLAIIIAMIIGNCTIDRRLDRLESAVLNQTQPVLQPGHVYLLHDSLFFKSPDGEVVLIKPSSACPGLPIQSSGNVIYPSSDEVKLIWPVQPDTIDWGGNLIYDKP